MAAGDIEAISIALMDLIWLSLGKPCRQIIFVGFMLQKKQKGSG